MQILSNDQPSSSFEPGVIDQSDEAESNQSLESIAINTDDNHSMELAIIGMAGRFPGAANIEEFWQNLANGVESISFFSEEEVAATGVEPAIYQDPHYVKAGGYLEGVENFDADFFNIYPREAAIMDPQHRIFLEVAWETLENAGYNPEDYPGWVGLFAGMSMNTYLMFNLLPNREIMDSVHGYQLTISSDKDFLPTRVSYKLNLRGPSINVQTACSTSLVAVHLACQSLLSYQCDMALAGGVSVRLPQKTGYLYQEGGITSPDGHCRAFDAQAAGTVSGNGAGAVLIKRLADAVHDGDTIHAIIKGSAINNDGSLKVGYTAPSVDGQAEVISMAQAVANVEPETISYIETHGTGTALGDPIEIAALTQVFRSGAQEELPPGFCAIGSVKTNVGHLDAAAGITSLIKTTLALEKRQIPPSLHFIRPNPKIDLEKSPFYVNTQLKAWETDGIPRRAGVSSFGIGGTNVHLILEEAPALSDPRSEPKLSSESALTMTEAEVVEDRPWKLLVLSARSPTALDNATGNLAKHLRNHPEISLTDVAFTLQAGRKAFNYRRILVCRKTDEAELALESRDPQRVFSGRPRESRGRSSGNSSAIRAVEYSRPQIVFMFSGQGAQYVDMSRNLYNTEEIFRAQVNHCAELLFETLGRDIREVIFAGGSEQTDEHLSPKSSTNQTDESDPAPGLPATSQVLMQTAITQPALFVVEYALARLLIHWGIEPEAMIGHSIGEYVAGCLAGVFSLEDALALVAARGRLMQQVAPGAMVSVPLSEAEVQAYLHPGLSLSAINGLSLCVISGSLEQIEALTYRLANDAIEYRRLRTSHAFHSEMMDEILEEFYRVIANVELSKPEIPFISNVSGTWITPEQATDPLYWVRHLRQTVRFGQGISELLKDPAWTFVEVGPGHTLVQLARGALTDWAAAEGRPVDERVLLPTLRPPRNNQPDQEFLLNTLGRLWLAGVEINWNAYHGIEDTTQDSVKFRRRVPLPTYPFENRRYWVEPDVPLRKLLAGEGTDLHTHTEDKVRALAGSSARSKRLLKKSVLPETWFYTPSWKRSLDLHRINPAQTPENEVKLESWLVFSLPEEEGRQVNGHSNVLRSRLPDGTKLIEVLVGPEFLRVDGECYQINPVNPDDYLKLVEDLRKSGQFPTRIVNWWSLDEGDQKGFLGLLYFVKACDRLKITQFIQMEFVTSGAYDVTGDEILHPDQSPGIALCKVISQEYPNITCRNIDLVFSAGIRSFDTVAEAVIAELSLLPRDRYVAYRGNHRWVQVYTLEEDTQVGQASSLVKTLVRQGGVYLITGGLGRIGLELAEYLARKAQARLVLLDRFEFPPRSDWQNWLSDHGTDDSISIRILRLLALEEIGAHVLVISGDVAKFSTIQSAFQTTQGYFGALNGVIHAAGIVGDAAIKPVAESIAEDFLKQFAPKVDGIKALHDVLKSINPSEKPDFVFIQSSLSTVLGGLGLGAYAAANAEMDLLAAQYNLEEEYALRQPGALTKHATRWISVDWDGWQFTPPVIVSTDGETNARTSNSPNLGISQRSGLDLTMTPTEGVKAFEYALELAAGGIHHLVISVADLSTRLDQWIFGISQGSPNQSGLTALPFYEPEGIAGSSSRDAASASSFTRPNLQTTYIAPRNDLESTVVQVWEKVLGITPIGVYDDFFELGGHSLLATQLVTRLRDTFRVELPLRGLFESPNIASLVALIEESSSSITQSGEQSLEGQQPQSDSTRISKSPRDELMPLSFGQQRLWFIDQFEPGSPLYNNFAALRLTGRLDQEALIFSLQKIVDRHESLRTTFAEHGGQPVQIIHPTTVGADLSDYQAEILIEIIDFQLDAKLLSPAEREAEIFRLAIREASQPFNLRTGPLFRIKLLEIIPDEHIIFITMHHIVSDGWSVAVMVGEVGALYAAYLAQKSGDNDIDLDAILPELPIQYVDYAIWQRQWLQGEELDRQIAYWKAKLAGIQQLELLPDFPRPAIQTWHGASHWFELPVELSTSLVELSQREGVTLFMTLLAGLQILLMRYSGQEDISVGTPIANRTRSEVESLIGFILNTLIMRTESSGNPSFRDYLGQVRETALGAYAHQDLPFEMLVEALQPQRDMSRAPFFQVMFDLQVSPLQGLNLPELTITPIPIDSGTAKFDLALSIEESMIGKDHILRGYLNYNTDLFEKQTIERMLEHFKVLLHSIVSSPEQSIWQMPIIDPEEQRTLLSTLWQTREFVRATDPSNMGPGLIHKLITRQAIQTPDAPALSLITGTIEDLDSLNKVTYKELEDRADQVANRLIALGVVPETLVGLCTDRSIEMIIGLLAILKAGGAVLPLDPTYPAERVDYMLADSQAPIVLSQRNLLDRNPELLRCFSKNGLKMVLMDSEHLEINNHPKGEDNIQIETDLAVRPENLAYVIYTSGSTGKPKGVMITHEAISGHCQDMVRHFEITPNDHILQFASVNFDAGLEQIFTALISGAWLFIRDDNVWPANEFQEYIERLELTSVNIPPAYWRPWVQFVAEKELQATDSQMQISAPTLRLVIIGGDVMSLDTLKLWQQTSLHRVRLLNAYGPTETTITAATYQVPDRSVIELSGSHYPRIPIGTPHKNRAAYVLDQYGGLTPLGCPGELHFGGAYLSRGYLNQPGLTAEKFIADPFIPGGLMYKTGDLVRWLPDGSLDFLGRVDQQVKLRGFRIELGEIEAVISSHPNIAECTVVIHESSMNDALEEKRLVAFIKLTPGQFFNTGELYDYTKARLPGYMIPAVFVPVGDSTDIADSQPTGLTSFPLTPSGKVDRKALSKIALPEGSSAQRKKVILAPRSPLEQEILDIWRDVLNPQAGKDIVEISIDDNFFELGGHSLLATQIVARIRQQYQVDLPLRQLFENPTIVGIASLIVQSLGAVEIERMGEDNQQGGDDDDIEALLAELEQMSDEEAHEILSNRHPGQDT